MVIMTDLRRDTFHRVQELSFSYFDHTNSGWLIARMNNDTSSIGDVLSWDIISMFWALFDLFFTLITMFTNDWLLSLVVCASIPVVAIVIPLFEKALLKRWRTARNAYSHFVGWLAEAINGSKTIKTLSIEDEVSSEAKTIVDDIQKKRWKAGRMNAAFQPLVSFVSMGMMFFDFLWMERANHRLKEAAQKEKEAAQKEKDASDAKSDFFSRMSHDIRTPLNVVIGSSTLALKENNNATTQRYLSDIDQSGKFLLSLVNDLLDLNKVQSGNMVLHPIPYSLKEFAFAMHSIVGPLCEEKNLTLVIEGCEDSTPYLIDAVRFKQIFYNLLSNSVKFTPNGGKITLRASWGEVKDGYHKLMMPPP